jgi:hypothetical protein
VQSKQKLMTKLLKLQSQYKNNIHFKKYISKNYSSPSVFWKSRDLFLASCLLLCNKYRTITNYEYEVCMKWRKYIT